MEKEQKESKNHILENVTSYKKRAAVQILGV